MPRGGGAVNRLGLAALAFAILAGVGVATAQLLGSEPPSPYYYLMPVAAAILLAVPAYLRGPRDPLAPALVFAVIFTVYYVLRPLRVLSTGMVGPAKAAYDIPIAPVMDSIRTALLLASIGVASFFLGYISTVRAGATGHAEREHSPWPVITRERFHLATVVALSCVCAFLTFLLLKSGGLAAYLGQIGYRQRTFANIAFLTQLSVPVKAALFVALLSRRAAPPHRVTWGVIATLGAFAATADVFSGGRSNLIVGTTLPALLIVHYALTPLRARTVLIAGLVLLVIAVGFRVVFRDSQFSGSSNHSRASLLQESYQRPVDAIVGGHDAIAFDSLATLNGAYGRTYARRLGSTYLDAFTFPVPRALWPGKPLGGGNAWFTSTYFPGYYGDDHVETSVTLLGEAEANFGLAGVLLVPVLLGAGLAYLYRRTVESLSAKSILVYANVAPYAFTLIRGDAYHSIPSALIATGASLFVLNYCTTSESAARARGVDRAALAPDLRNL
jgi:oligosaccharide repeat unit polymerase